MTRATIATEIGDIDVELYDQSAPEGRAELRRPARRRASTTTSSSTACIPGFVIQGGDGQYGKKASLDTGRVGTGGPGYKFEDEPVKGDYVRGALAMANAGPEHERQPVLHLPPTT